jgi:hypothetical protein
MDECCGWKILGEQLRLDDLKKNKDYPCTLAELMQTTNMVALAKFVACCQYQRIICPP